MNKKSLCFGATLVLLLSTTVLSELTARHIPKPLVLEERTLEIGQADELRRRQAAGDRGRH